MDSPPEFQNAMSYVTASGGGYLEIRSLVVTFLQEGRTLSVLDNVDLSAEPGEVVAVVGPSGCGKSTLVHVVAGFVAPTAGEIRVDGQGVRGPDPSRGVVLQELGLLPWLTVRQNVEFGLKLQGLAAMDRRRVVDELLQRVKLDRFSEYYPQQLSGGMAQRVAVARALAPRPKLLLLDEPFGALDAQTRLEMQTLLLEVHAHEGVTVLLVTHDVEEALFLGTRVVLLSARPARVVRDFRPGIPWPRSYTTLTNPQLVGAKREILTALRDEVLCASAEQQMALLHGDDSYLRVGVVEAADALPLYVTARGGRRANVALDLLRHDSGPALIRALLEGHLDVALVGACPVLAALHNGAPLEILRDGGHLLQGRHAAGLVVHASLRDASRDALRSQSMGVNGFGTNAEFLTRAALNANVQDLHFSVMPNQQIVAEMAAGRLGVAALFPPHLGHALALDEVSLRTDFLQLLSPLQSSVLVGAKGVNDERRAQIARFLAEWDESVSLLLRWADHAGTRPPVELQGALDELVIAGEEPRLLPIWSLDSPTERLIRLHELLRATNTTWGPLELKNASP